MGHLFLSEIRGVFLTRWLWLAFIHLVDNQGVMEDSWAERRPRGYTGSQRQLIDLLPFGAILLLAGYLFAGKGRLAATILTCQAPEFVRLVPSAAVCVFSMR
jgi:hypothetical protein